MAVSAAAGLQMGIKIVMTVRGSGPFGEAEDDAPIYTLEPHPPELALKSLPQSVVPTRRDVDLGPRATVFVIDNVLTEGEADVLAAVSERLGYSKYAPLIQTPPGMRQNVGLAWLPSGSTVQEFVEPLMARIRHLLPPEINGRKLYPHLSHRFAHYKYNDGDVFQRHIDGAWPGQSLSEDGDSIDNWPGVQSELSMLLYLSGETDGVQGGHTRIFRFDNGDPVDVAPRKGSALFFRHGFGRDSVFHMGTRVIGNVPKYIVRINVLYECGEDSD